MPDPRDKPPKVTMADVAREADVSKASVSRVLTGRSGAVTEATARKVHRAISSLGYVPNAVAASLAYQTTKAIGFILADLANPFFALVAAGIESTIQDAGYRLLVANTDGSPEREVAQTQLFLEHQVDAMIVATSSVSTDHLARAVGIGVPVTVVDSRVTGLGLDCVLADNRGGARLATEHLLELGHTDIAVIRGLMTDSASSDRVEATTGAIANAGHEILPDRVVVGGSTVEGGYIAARQLFESPTRPTALFVMNNLMTVGAMRAVADLGLSIPSELSLIGFDDMDWYPIAAPPITAVAQPA